MEFGRFRVTPGRKITALVSLASTLASLGGALSAQTLGFQGADLGEPGLAGGFEVLDGGVDVFGAGESIGGRADQGYFYSVAKVGDFDVRVRLSDLDFVDVWTKAGLMVRAGSEMGSPQFSILATPSISGILAQYRTELDALAEATGNHRVNYPHTWLRLRRDGSRVSGYSGFDGTHWTLVESVEIELPETAQLGLVVNSHSSETVAVASFRDYSDVVDPALGAQERSVELPGPSSRRSGLAFTEIMYHPADREDGLDLEFVELMNTDAVPREMGGYRLAGSVSFVFPDDYRLMPGRYIVIAKSSDDVRSAYGVENVEGNFEGSLPNDSGLIQLLDRQGAILLETQYQTRDPWPVAPDGTGHSLVLSRPSYGEGDAQAWSASSRVGGSPGSIDPVIPSPLDPVVINEFLANSDEPAVDYIELYNHSNVALDLCGASLSDDPSLSKFEFPPGTTIEPRGFVVVDETSLGFALSSSGEQIFLRSADGQRVYDAIRFAGQAPQRTFGRFPDGNRAWVPLADGTPGDANSLPETSPIVINEIMYNPISGLTDGEYVELYNAGSEAVDLSGWRLAGGIRFDFPAGSSLLANGFLVVAKNAALLRQNHPQLNEANTLGDFSGRLSNAGETIELQRPETEIAEGEGNGQFFVTVDAVSYRDSDRWGKWADGGGSSLELRDPKSDNRYGENWAASVEAEKSEWTVVETTARLESAGIGNIDDFQIFMQGAGECLVDDVEFIDQAGTSFLTNGGFDDGRRDWFFQGTHDQSVIEASADDELNSVLHIKATARGDNGANRIRYRFRRPYAEEGTMATIRARVKWLRGSREILFRPKGNYMEAIGTMNVPANTGSPGLPNGQLANNLGPVIEAVNHFPVLPRAGEPVLVTARVEDLQGVGNVSLDYRLDPEETVISRPMRDDGSQGDAIAGDGIYSAWIDGQAEESMVAFVIRASDGAATTASSSTGECLVGFGQAQPFGNFGTYRIWITSETEREWTRRLRLHNGDLGATFVYGNQRVVHDAGTLYSGSPWVSPSYSGPRGNLCGYVLHLPKDDQVLGAADFVLDWPIRDSTLQLEQVAFWMAEQMDVPYLRRRNIHLFVNGTKRGRVYEDVQQPNRDVMNQFHPEDSEGELYKIEDWFEFSSGGTRQSNRDATLLNFLDSEGDKFLPRYRYNWRKRAVRGSAHDYDSLFQLVDTMNLPTSQVYTDEVNALVDVENWLGVFAVEHIIGNWDSYGYDRGKNMYAYKPVNGKWALHIWDMDFALDSNARSARSDMFQTNEPMIRRMYFHPPFTRMYYQAMQKAVDGPLRESASNAVLEANFDALAENGIRSASFRGGQRYIATRRNYLEGQISQVDSRFQIATNGGTEFTSNQNLVTLQGTAPINLHSITVNDVPHSLRWIAADQWELEVLLTARDNSLRLRGFSKSGEFIRGALDAIQIGFSGELETPEDSLVINEIMYEAPNEGGEYIELHNTSNRTAFSLAGYRLSGLGYEFSPDAVILPREHLLIVADATAFAETYGSARQVIGEYAGRLNPNGETLRLVRQAEEGGEEQLIDEVTYGVNAPWPSLAAGEGSSLQLIDPNRDNDRIANWGAVGEPDDAEEWNFASVTGIAGDNNLLVFLSGNPPSVVSDGIEGLWTGYVEVETDRDDVAFRFDRQPDGSLLPYLLDGGQEVPFDSVTVNGSNVLITFNPEDVEIRLEAELTEDGLEMAGRLVQIHPEFGTIEGGFFLQRDYPGGRAYIDDVVLVAGSEAAVGVNLVTNGDFEADLAGSWQVSVNHQGSEIVDTEQHSGARSLLVRADVGGFDLGTAIAQSIDGLVVGEEYTLSFRYLPAGAGVGLSVGLGDCSLLETVDIEPRPVVTTLFTPGAPNSNRAFLSAFPTLRINELQVVNTSGPMDAFGDQDPWVEIFNSGTEAINLSGFALSDDLAAASSWRFPDGSMIEAGSHTVVWLDAEEDEASPDELHAGFKIDSSTSNLSLLYPSRGELVLLDAIRIPESEHDTSFGLFPDGRANTLQPFLLPTLGGENAHAQPELEILISEWMARNETTLSDPADPTGMEFDDWFELYNAGDQAIDLSGFYLSDRMNDPTKYRIPVGTIIAPGQVLLVWADEQEEQNEMSSDLHVNFKLSGNGESIGLYGPGGLIVDEVEFGEQEPDVSEGRPQLDNPDLVQTFDRPTPGSVGADVEPVEILSVSVAVDGTVSLVFTSEIGRSYQVRYRDSIDQESWLLLGDPVIAGSDVTELLDTDAQLSEERYYSVLQLE